MKRLLAVTLMSLLCSATTLANTDQVSTGQLVLYPDFESEYVGKRTVSVWTPDGFKATPDTAVLFMHDGQMLFDAKVTWNKQEWGVDETMGRLLLAGSIRTAIVVAINNAGPDKRGPEFFPAAAVNYFNDPAERSKYPYVAADLRADDYIKFIVQELKPFVEQQFGVVANKANSFLMGSSMGGLISLYTVSKYPDEFAGAACLSTHWPGSIPAEGTDAVTDALLAYFNTTLPKSGSHRLYFDYGTATLDRFYPPLQARFDQIMRDKGFDNTNWVTREFPGASHDENAWRDRLDIPLTFLLGSANE